MSKPAPSIKHIDFYFDFISPYAYFAWFRVQEVCRARNLELRLHPILFAGLLNHWGQLGPAEIPPKREFLFKDGYRYAKLHGLEFECPKFHPFNPLTALRVALPEVAGANQTRIVDALYRASWGRGGDLGNEAELIALLDGAGFPGKELVEKTKDSAVKSALRKNTEQAIARGLFGVPTMIAGDELFWGSDRFDHLELYLDGRDPLAPEFVARVLSRPKAVDRRDA